MSATTGMEPVDEVPVDEVRVDRWLHSVRIVPTRSAATDACRGGRVRVNGSVAKPATSVRVGDRVEATVASGVRVLEVTRLLDRRVGAAIAVQCYEDHSAPPPPRQFVAPAGRRDPGSGRPTKRDRRAIDRLRGRSG